MVSVKPTLTQNGSDHHLIVKGFSCSDRPGSVQWSIEEFFIKLYGEESLVPLQCCDHKIIGHPGQTAGRILQLSLAVKDGVSMSLDAALRSFCQKFFNNSDRSPYQQLSIFGTYGFSPQEGTMKYFWYEAMFTWMSSYRMEELAQMEAHMANIEASGIGTSWRPSWRGGLLLGLSLGLAWGASAMFGVKLSSEKAFEVVGAINCIMIREAGDREEQGFLLSAAAAEQCREFVGYMENVITILNKNPTEDRPQMVLHGDATTILIKLFETGYVTVTACKEAALVFQKARDYYAVSFVFSAVQVGYLGFKMSSQVPTVPQSSVFSRMGWIPLAISVGQATYSAVKGYQTEEQRKKWSKIAVYVAASMRLAQGCECYLRWTYNSGVCNGRHTPEYYNELRKLMQAMEASEPLPEECTPEAVRARLVQHAETLSVQKEKIISDLN